MSTELSRLSELAKADKTTRFLSIAHLVTPAALMTAFEGLRKDASAGVDEVPYRGYEQDVWRNIPALHDRLVSHRYRVQPLRRVYIPKENGTPRPISIPILGWICGELSRSIINRMAVNWGEGEQENIRWDGTILVMEGRKGLVKIVRGGIGLG